MKALKINAETKTIEQIEISKNYKEISQNIGNGCELFCVPIDYENGDAMYADDESLLRYDSIKGGFMFPNWAYPIVGNAIILGTDEEGDSTDCITTIENLKDIIWVGEKACKQWAEMN